jgi:hypothetical protein
VNFGEQWRLKLHFIRKKLRGWSINLKALKRRNKDHYQTELNRLQLLHEDRQLDDQEIDSFQIFGLQLDKLYLEEEQY